MEIRRSDTTVAGAESLPGVVEVGLGEWRVGSGSLETTSGPTQVIIAAYNKRTSKGLLGLFGSITPVRGIPSEFLDTDSFDAALAAVADLGPNEHTEMWIGGSETHVDTSVDHGDVMVAMEYASRALVDFWLTTGVEETAVHTQWDEHGDGLSVALNCGMGVLYVSPVAGQGGDG